MSYTVSSKNFGTFDAGGNGVVEKILQGIANVLVTPKGSVPLYRDFGLDMRPLDRPEPIAKQRMRSNIREAVERWVPEAVVVDMDIEDDPAQPGRPIFTVEVELDAKSA